MRLVLYLSPEGFVSEGGLDDVLAVIEGSLDTDAVDVGVGDGGHLPLLNLANPAFWEHDEAVHVLLAAQTVNGGRACECFTITTTIITRNSKKRKTKKNKKTHEKNRQSQKVRQKLKKRIKNKKARV